MNKTERDKLRIQPTTHPGTVVMRSKDMLSLLDTCDELEAEIVDRKDCERSLTEWNEQLAQKVERLEAKLAIAVDALEEIRGDSTNESNTQPKEDS